MIKLPMSDTRYQEIASRLNDPDLSVRLSSNPTTMGPQYVSDKIVEILTAKSVVNDLLDEVEKAYTKVQLLVHDLHTELEIRTHIELNSLEDGELKGLNATEQRAVIREKVDRSYQADRLADLPEGDPAPGPLQLWEDIRMAEGSEIELKALISMLDRRRDELGKMDSGVRLQQKTIDSEMRIQKNVLSQHIVNGKEQEFDGVIPNHTVDPDGGDEESETNGMMRIPEGSGVG